MKKFIAVIGLSITLLFSGFVMAEVRIAIIDAKAVIQQMSQTKTMQEKLKSEFDPKVKKLQEEGKKASEAQQKLKKESMTLSQSEQTKLNNIIESYLKKENELSIEIKQRENEELRKLYTLVDDAITKVSQKNEYDIILNADSAFYFSKVVDISDQVLEQVKK